MATVIFDFDGTIADSFGVGVQIAAELLHRDHFPPDQVERLRGMSILQIAEELRVPPWKLSLLAARGRARMRSQMTTVKAFPAMPKVLKQLAASGHRLYIMSSNSAQNIEVFLEKNGLSSEFVQIYGGVGIFGKARVLKKILQQNKLDPESTYYVGDEIRDITAAKRAGVNGVAVTWGYNNMAVLAKHEPYLLVQEPKELLGLPGTIDTHGQ